MPLFGSNKFSPKKGIARRSTSLSNLNLDSSQREEEFGLHYGPIKLKLGENEMVFENGHWVAEGVSTGVNSRELIQIRKQNHQLHEENNLLKLKIELLLDMLAQSTANSSLQENEIERFKKLLKKK